MNIYYCMTSFLTNASLLLPSVSFITSLNSKISTAVNIQNTTESNCVISHAQNTTASQPSKGKVTPKQAYVALRGQGD
jgi:hypothetical protein